jgi:phosphatidylglycerophosphate synthase
MTLLRTIPNAVSALRPLIGLIIILFALSITYETILLLLVIAYATDLLDGYLARRVTQPSYFGYFFDSFCDRVLDVCLIIFFLTRDQIHPLFSLIVIARTLAVYGLRAFDVASHRNIKLRFFSLMFGVGLQCFFISKTLQMIFISSPVATYLAIASDVLSLTISASALLGLLLQFRLLRSKSDTAKLV